MSAKLRPSAKQAAIEFVYNLTQTRPNGIEAFMRLKDSHRSHMIACDEVAIIMTGKFSPYGMVAYQKIYNELTRSTQPAYQHTQSGVCKTD